MVFGLFKKTSSIDDILDSARQESCRRVAKWMLYSGYYSKVDVREQLTLFAPEKRRAHSIN